MGLDGQHVVELVKITDYLLSPTHPTGRYKARFFSAFGFVATDPFQFAAALERHARSRAIVRVAENEFGVKREVRCNLATPDGRDPCVVAIWLQTTPTAPHRLITVYPARDP